MPQGRAQEPRHVVTGRFAHVIAANHEVIRVPGHELGQASADPSERLEGIFIWRGVVRALQKLLLRISCWRFYVRQTLKSSSSTLKALSTLFITK